MNRPVGNAPSFRYSAPRILWGRRMVPTTARAVLALVAMIGTMARPGLATAEPWPAECKGPLTPSVVGGCAGVTHAGCCDPRGRVLYCKGADLYCVDCAGQLPACGWTPFGHYDCGTTGGADPSGDAPKACPAECDASCTATSPCSPTCPGSCGHCAGGRACLEDGECHQPECGDHQCGVDANGLACGVCPHGTECVSPLFQCLPRPAGCTARRGPGSDGAPCETCVCARYPGCCQWNWDAFCAAACEQECGQDCTACPAEPQCAPGQCGPFCGLDCGGCPAGQACWMGACCTPACTNDDGSARQCGPDGCGGSCGACEDTWTCVDGTCVACQPQCEGRQCGPDGCGGSCGTCEAPAACDEAGQCKTPGSCAGACSGGSDNCYCDPVCQSYGDCCPDFCEACPAECATDPCPGIPAAGCCQDEVLWQCVQGAAQSTDCAATPLCGWNADANVYQCGTTGLESHQHVKACPATFATPLSLALPMSRAPFAPPLNGMALPLPVLLVALLLALAGCSGGDGNGVRDTSRPDTAAPGDVDALEAADVAPPDAIPDVPPEQHADARDADPGTPDLPDDAEVSDVPPPDPAPDVLPDAPDPGLDVPVDAPADAETEQTTPFSCLHLPQGPLELEKIDGTIAAEDLAFDGEGYLIGSDMSAVYKSAPGLPTKVLVPNLPTRAGMRLTPAGFLALNDDTQGRLLLFGPDGALDRVLAQGLAYPNGMAVDLDGFVYVTEHNAGRVLRVHPYTGEVTVLVEGLDYPNGITFNADYTRLYVGTFGGSKIWTLTISRDGKPGRLEVFADLSDTPGQLDGMGVDACGNVYVCEYGSTDIWRIAPDGKSKTRIVDSDPSITYLPNLQWGRGEGWDPSSIYVPDGWNVGVWRVHVGVPSAPLPFP